MPTLNLIWKDAVEDFSLLNLLFSPHRVEMFIVLRGGKRELGFNFMNSDNVGFSCQEMEGSSGRINFY